MGVFTPSFYNLPNEKGKVRDGDMHVCVALRRECFSLFFFTFFVSSFSFTNHFLVRFWNVCMCIAFDVSSSLHRHLKESCHLFC